MEESHKSDRKMKESHKSDRQRDGSFAALLRCLLHALPEVAINLGFQFSFEGSLDEFKSLNYDKPHIRYTIFSDRDGYVESFQTKKIGEALSSIGAGRLGNADGIDDSSGLKVYKKISDRVSSGDPILEFYCASEQKINNLKKRSNKFFKISGSSVLEQKLIYQ